MVVSMATSANVQRCQNTTVLPANLSLSVYAAVFQDGSTSVGLCLQYS